MLAKPKFVYKDVHAYVVSMHIHTFFKRF